MPANVATNRSLGTDPDHAAAGNHGHGGAGITGTSGVLGDVLTVTNTSPLEATWAAPTGGGGGGGGLTQAQALTYQTWGAF
jgi:hypothetical protein